MPRQLAPGLRVVRRGPGALQVGLSADRRVVLPRTPVVLAALDRLLDRVPPVPRDDEVLARLEAAGCLTEGGAPSARRSVAVLGDLGIDHAPLLRAAGLLAEAATAPTESSSEVLLVLRVGEVDRALLDPVVRRGTDHLVVRLVDGGATIGPFVVPGSTACLRCVDAHGLVLDPHHVEVTARYVQATATPSRRRCGRPRGPGAGAPGPGLGGPRPRRPPTRTTSVDVVAHGAPRRRAGPRGADHVATTSGLWMLLARSRGPVRQDGGMKPHCGREFSR